jgi:hypothetical protein
MRTKFDRQKHLIKKRIRKKQITIKKMRTKVNIKIKLNQNFRGEKKQINIKYNTIKILMIKFDIINK